MYFSEGPNPTQNHPNGSSPSAINPSQGPPASTNQTSKRSNQKPSKGPNPSNGSNSKPTLCAPRCMRPWINPYQSECPYKGDYEKIWALYMDLVYQNKPNLPLLRRIRLRLRAFTSPSRRIRSRAASGPGGPGSPGRPWRSPSCCSL